MANADSTSIDRDQSTNEEKRRQGALACLAAMRQLEADAAEMPEEPRPWLMKRYGDAKRLAQTIGPLSPEVEGAIMALAEYMHYWQTTGGANLEPGTWMPVASMTDDQVNEWVDRVESSVDA